MLDTTSIPYSSQEKKEGRNVPRAIAHQVHHINTDVLSHSGERTSETRSHHERRGRRNKGGSMSNVLEDSEESDSRRVGWVLDIGGGLTVWGRSNDDDDDDGGSLNLGGCRVDSLVPSK